MAEFTDAYLIPLFWILAKILAFVVVVLIGMLVARRTARNGLELTAQGRSHAHEWLGVKRPPEEPPDIRVRSCGLRDGPSCAFSPVKS